MALCYEPAVCRDLFGKKAKAAKLELRRFFWTTDWR